MRGKPKARSPGARLGSLGTLLVALLLAALLLPGPGAAKLKRERVMALLVAELEARGLAVENVSRCSPRKKRGKKVFVCKWRAEGTGEGDVEYRCAGRAVYYVAQRRWRIDKCDNLVEAQIALKPEPGPHPAFGYNEDLVHLGDPWYDLLDRSAAQVARQLLIWEAIERKPGQYDWHEFDALYRELLERGIRPLWILFHAPCWAQDPKSGCEGGTGDPGNYRPQPTHYDEMASFAALAAQRYPEAVGIEVWNEPNFHIFWGGKPDPEAYGAMLKRVAGAIHQANPSMPVISAGLSPHSTTTAEGVAYDEFLDKLYRDGAAQQADAIGMHPYPSISFNGGYIERLRVHLARVDKVMRNHGDGDTPVAVTEVGVATEGDEAYTPDQQAQALVDIYNTLRRVEGIPLVVIHRFRDDQTPGTLGNNERGFGVVSSDGDPKPALCAMAGAVGRPCGG